MKSGYSANFKTCVTCAYWTGRRSLNSTRTRAEYDSGVNGDCVQGSSTIRFRNKSPSASCSNWEKWGQLKSTTSSNRSRDSSTGKKDIGLFDKIFFYFRIVAAIIAGVVILFNALMRFIAENKEIFIVIGVVLLISFIIGFFFYKKSRKNQKEISEEQNNQSNATDTEIQPISSEIEMQSTSFEAETQTISLDTYNNNPVTDGTSEFSQKKWLTALLLLIFLGTLGIHRFYVGKIVTGIFMLLITIISFTLGIGFMSFIWYIIDLILLCTGKFKDKKGNAIKKG